MLNFSDVPDIIVVRFSKEEKDFWIDFFLHDNEAANKVYSLGEDADDGLPEVPTGKDVTFAAIMRNEERENFSRQVKSIYVDEDLYDTQDNADTILGGFDNDGVLEGVNQLLRLSTNRKVKPVSCFLILNVFTKKRKEIFPIFIISPELKIML